MSNLTTVNKDLPVAECFMNKVIAEFQSGTGSELALTNFQKRLAQNYFIVADSVLKTAEEKRTTKTEKFPHAVPVTWSNIDMEELAQSVVSAARIGWDPMQNNHVSLIPFKDNAAGKYKINFMPGYRGIELKAVKYGLDVPDNVVVELVYSTDKFKSYKKDRNNKIESYDFEITNDFDRGSIVGGFYCHGYSNAPEKNKVVTFSMKDIEKRKPEYASAEFWGGEKAIWKDGKKVGTEHTDGWFDKMCYKTIYRAAYNDITIDSQKIDDDFLRLRQQENDFKEAEVEQTIAENANQEPIDITPPEEKHDVNEVDAEIVHDEVPAKQETAPDSVVEGPGF